MRKNTGSMLDELEAVCITATRHAPQMRFSQVRFLVAAAKATRPQNFHPPGATHAELAKQTDVTPAAITRAVDVFGNGRKDRDQPGFGFVQTVADQSDDRVKYIRITEAGLDYLTDLCSI